jgi:predicted transport protein
VANLEKVLQTLIEENLEVLLGARLLASEYATGKAHGGRIDTLALDENGSPVIIEYKRNQNENVINQGLFYLDWLMDHKAEFEQLVQKSPWRAKAAVDWLNPRLLCIAADFNRYDEYAVQQIDRNISLIRYKRFGADLLILELVNATTSKASAGQPGHKTTTEKTVEQLLKNSDPTLAARFEALREFTLSLGDDVQMKTLKFYFAFTRLKNFACMEVHPKVGKVLVYLRLDPSTVQLVDGLTRDVRNVGHYGTGDLEVTVDSDEDVLFAKELIAMSYQGG